MSISFSGVPATVVFTAQLSDLHVLTSDSRAVTVSVTGSGGASVFTERYWPCDGRIAVRGLGRLLEEYLSAALHPYGEFQLTATDGRQTASATVRAVYCSRFAPQLSHDALSTQFLTTMPLRRVPRGAELWLYLYAAADESLAWTLSVLARHRSTGQLLTATAVRAASAVASAAGVRSILISPELMESVIPEEEAEIIQYTVTCGQRSATFFVDDSLRKSDSFFFANSFNVVEVVWLPMLSVEKNSVERSTAVVDGSSRQYNLVPSQTFEAECGPLTRQEAEWLAQMLASPRIYRSLPLSAYPDEDGDATPQVLVTDSTCEVSSDPSDVVTVKFTWRYADNRTFLPCTFTPERFTDTFNTVFS